MFICPTCNREFHTEQIIQRHFLTCWKEQHPFHKSKPAPRSANIETREANDDVMNFFKGINNARSKNF